ATGWSLADQIRRDGEDPGIQAKFEVERILEMRAGRVPLQYCLGYTAFMGLRFAVAPGVFIPRPDTETLVEVTLSLIADCEHPRLLEIGCGSGAVSISLLKLAPQTTIVAVDSSNQAIRLTERNATTHGVAQRLITVEGDWTGVAGRRFDG